ncbi:hypothetical protein OS493_000085 [Desmophyllum pertusum]|uniref:LicD/FKTN/FKRP nucleotidyltransferase domain-containing protein n=1 Tax=Desmophyllum pertusum TaxID=174260 RepID=A0A9X0A6Z4_9CNID|nr:hypothetical protein OS493_000085 [Desmophyllum pertusum]
MKKAAALLLFSLVIVAVIFLVTVVFQIDSASLLRSKTKQTFTAVANAVIDPNPKYDYVNLKRTYKHCKIPLEYGEMCPKLYTELGGRCDLIKGAIQCPDIRNYSRSTARQGQLVLTRMIRIFHLLAQKHGIKYWIARGTLLGAARHHGMIPWDVDADIEMPLDDYVKFFQMAAKEFPADIFFQNFKSDPALRPSDADMSSFHMHDIVGIYQATWNPRLRDRNSCYKYCLAYNCKWHDGLMVDIFVFPKVDSAVYPLKRMTFEGFPFAVQNNWKEELVSSYGKDWFEVPTDKSPEENPDVFNGCEKLKKSN